MADPIIANGIRVLSIWQGVSGLPEDRYITTWAFSTPGPSSDADVTTAISQVRQFFAVVATPATLAVRQVLNGQGIDELTSELRGYQLGDTPPREPTIETFASGALSTSNPLPSEVAICCSFYSERSLPSQRGRTYIGPLAIDAQNNDDGVSRPHPAAVAAIANAAERMAGLEDPVRWCVLGHPAGGVPTLFPVTGGWVDNAFDTQRRRGEAATDRTTWALP